jgi:hypothetical protein
LRRIADALDEIEGLGQRLIARGSGIAYLMTGNSGDKAAR